MEYSKIEKLNKELDEVLNNTESKLREKSENCKKAVIPGLDIMPTKSTLSAMSGAPQVTMKSYEYYKYS